MSNIDPAVDPAIDHEVRAFLKQLNASGGKPMEQLSPPEARAVLTALVIGFAIGPRLIRRFREMKFGHGYIDDRTGAQGQDRRREVLGQALQERFIKAGDLLPALISVSRCSVFLTRTPTVLGPTISFSFGEATGLRCSLPW